MRMSHARSSTRQGVGFCVHSTSEAHLREALAVERLELSEGEMERLSTLALQPLL